MHAPPSESQPQQAHRPAQGEEAGEGAGAYSFTPSQQGVTASADVASEKHDAEQATTARTTPLALDATGAATLASLQLLYGGGGGAGRSALAFRRPSTLELKDANTERERDAIQAHLQTHGATQQQGTPQRHTPPRSRRGSHGDGHQVRVCMFTMPQSCVLPLEARPYAHLYATTAGYPYYDPRQLQGGGVTTNYRTKPNPLLQYHTGPTFAPNRMQQQQQQQGQASAYQQMRQPAGFSDSYSTQMPQATWGYDMSQMQFPRAGDTSNRAYSTMQYQQRRQRRTYDSGSQSLPSSRLHTPTHAAVAGGFIMPPGGMGVPPAQYGAAAYVTPAVTATAGGVIGAEGNAPAGISTEEAAQYSRRPSTAPTTRGVIDVTPLVPVAVPSEVVAGPEAAAEQQAPT